MPLTFIMVEKLGAHLLVHTGNRDGGLFVSYSNDLLFQLAMLQNFCFDASLNDFDYGVNADISGV